VEDLDRHHAVLYRRSGPVSPWLFPRDGATPEEIIPKGRLRFDDLAAIADAAIAGMGMAWLPSWLVRDQIKTGALVPILSDQPPFPYDVHALWPRTPRLSPKVRAAIDALAEKLPRFMTLSKDRAEGPAR
jgi:DNA-binding transcriptional LysR family regulator